MNQQQFTARYIVKSEPAPTPKPRWWRSMWFVIDTQTDEVVGKWLAWGTANMQATCANRPELAFCSHTANLAERNAERWGVGVMKPLTVDADIAAADSYYTLEGGARLMGVSYHTISRAVRANRLPHIRIGRQVLVSLTDLNAWEPQYERAPRKYRGQQTPDESVRPMIIGWVRS